MAPSYLQNNLYNSSFGVSALHYKLVEQVCLHKSHLLTNTSDKCFSQTLAYYSVIVYQMNVMKDVWQKIFVTANDGGEASYTRNTILMILIFISFFGASFYVMLESLWG